MGELFGNLEKQVNKFSKEKEEAKIPDASVNFTENPAFNLEYIRDQVIANLNNLTDKQVYDMIKVSYAAILQKLSVERDENYIKAFMNPRFLNIFVGVIGSVDVTYSQRLYCNKIAYHYMTTDKIEKDENIKHIFLNLSRSVNRPVISNLISIGLDEMTANYIAMYSASDEEIDICIRRTNLVIISSALEMMDVDTIISIYGKLEFAVRPLFRNMMCDVYMTEELKNISADASEIYGNMSLAVLAILEQMPREHIRLVLIDYTQHYGQSKMFKETRFGISSIAVCDYPRILETVDFLNVTEMVIVP